MNGRKRLVCANIPAVTPEPLDWFADSASWDRSCNAACEQHWKSPLQPCSVYQESWSPSQCGLSCGWRGGSAQTPLTCCRLSSQGWHSFSLMVGTATAAFFPCSFTGPLWTNLQLLISCHGLLHFVSVKVFKWSREVMVLAHASCWFWLRCCWEG